MLFGSDWPVCTLSASYHDVISVILRYLKQFSDEEQVSILGENAVRAYHLNLE